MKVKPPLARTIAYSLAVLAPAAVAAATRLFWPVGDSYPVAPYFLAIGFVAWYGSLGPGLVSVGFSVLLADYFFLTPPHLFWPTTLDQIDDLGMLLLIGSALTLLFASLQRSRSKAEMILRNALENESRYQAVFEYAPDGIITADPDDYYLEANPSMCRMIGYTSEEMTGLHATDIVTMAKRPDLRAAFREVVATSNYESEWLIRRKNGSFFAAEVIATALPNGNLLGVIRDVSDRNEANDRQRRQGLEIEHQRMRLNNIIANVPGVVFETWINSDAESDRMDFVSKYVETLLGYTVEEWLAQPNFWLSIVHPDDRDRVQASATADLATGAIGAKRQFRWIAKDGAVLWVESTSSVIKDDSGQTIGTRGVTVDVSEGMQAAQELRQSEDRYHNLVENAQDIIYTQDLQGNYTSVNQAAARITGYSREESLTMNLIDVVAPEYQAHAHSMFAQKLAGDDVTSYELEIVAKDGHKVAVEINTRVIKEGGVPVAVQGIARDISERKRLEEQFRQSQKMEAIGQLAGGIAHDFNNLLTVISGYSQLSLRAMHAADPLREHQEQIAAAAERATGLTSQLLAFSRKQVLQPTVLDLNGVVADVEKMLRRLIGENIELRAVLAPYSCRIKADRTQVEQMILNLAVNARDAMPDGGELVIETSVVEFDDALAENYPAVKAGRCVSLVVRDTGTGLDAATRARLFEPFFTTKEPGKGTGLGLSTVYGIVKQSDGNIFIDSKLGEGTCFSIFLPSVEDAADQVRKGDETSENLRGTETVLIVEDEVVLRHLTREVLELFGYRVLEAADGDSAIAVASSLGESIDLILTDVIMPGLSGPATAAKLATHCPTARVLFMSGYIDNEVIRAGLSQGEVNFIQKPFLPDQLAR
ncbi:MAG: PAS domain S-box protein, partial [Pyrinomonadaceae bacterium]